MSELSKKHSIALLVSLVILMLVYLYMILIEPIGNKNPNGVIFALHAIPAAVCLFFAYKNNYRGFIWVNYISMMLFCVASANIFNVKFDGYGWIIYVEVLMTSCVFLISLVAAMGYKKRAKKTA